MCVCVCVCVKGGGDASDNIGYINIRVLQTESSWILTSRQPKLTDKQTEIVEVTRFLNFRWVLDRDICANDYDYCSAVCT